MNKKQQELLDEAYENYLQHYDDEYNEEQKKIQKSPLHWMEMEYTNIRPYPKEMFINKCKTDTEFSEKWGLKIEERTILEQVDQNNPMLKGSTALYPRKLIIVTYNDKRIESYE
jgi:hypothetical protein